MVVRDLRLVVRDLRLGVRDLRLVVKDLRLGVRDLRLVCKYLRIVGRNLSSGSFLYEVIQISIRSKSSPNIKARSLKLKKHSRMLYGNNNETSWG